LDAPFASEDSEVEDFSLAWCSSATATIFFMSSMASGGSCFTASSISSSGIIFSISGIAEAPAPMAKKFQRLQQHGSTSGKILGRD